MRFLRSLVPCLIVLVAAPTAHGQSDHPNEAQLGPIVLIAIDSREPDGISLLPVEPRLGPVIPISAFFEVDADEQAPPPPPFEDDSDGIRLLPAYHHALPMIAGLPVGVIRQPMPAPIGEPFALGAPNMPELAHPAEIQAHLSAAAAQLAVAGLPGEARKIVEFQEQLDRNHSQQLLIAFKESQIRALQAEVHYLKRTQQHVASNAQVMLQMKVIELNPLARGAVLAKFKTCETDGCHKSIVGRNVVNCDAEWIDEVVGILCQSGDAKIVLEPSCVVLTGNSVRVTSGAETQRSVIAMVGDESIAEPSEPQIGAFISVTPKILNHELIQLKLAGEYRSTRGNDYDSLGFSKRHVQPAPQSDQFDVDVKVPAGLTMAMIGNDLGSTLLVLVTPEIVPSAQLLRSVTEDSRPRVFQTHMMALEPVR